MIDNREMTFFAIDKVLNSDATAWEEDNFDDMKYIIELDARNPVLEGILEHFKKLGVQIIDNKQLIKELNFRYRKMGIEDGAPKSVKKWLTGTPVDVSYRKNLYNLCLALEMTEEETIEFFLKNYLTLPFYYKDIVDAIYYYGIHHKKSYADIQGYFEMINDIESNDYEDEYTNQIGIDIAKITDDQIFLEYMKIHLYKKENKFKTTTAKLNELINQNAEYAEIERDLRYELGKERVSKDGNVLDPIKILRKNGSVNLKALLYVIYRFDNQEHYIDREPSIAKCKNLPKHFRENFPNDQEFVRIRKGSASPEVYRKALIIMKFYNFYSDVTLSYIYGTSKKDKILKSEGQKKSIEDFNNRDDEDILSDFDDFYIETSKLLEYCGFVQLYARNPFDWIILYCARSTDPLEAFRTFLETALYMDEE